MHDMTHTAWYTSMLALLQLVIPVYGLRLNRIFGTKRIGWGLVVVFSLLALLHLFRGWEPIGTQIYPTVALEVFYALIPVLLLIGMAHIEALFRERLKAEEEEKRMVSQLERQVQERTIELAHANAELRREVTERRQLHQQLLRAKKREVTAQLAGGVADNFNDLIHLIEGSAAALLKRTEDTATKEQLKRIAATAACASGLTRQLLALVRRHPMVCGQVDLNNFLEEHMGTISRTVGQKIAVRKTYALELPPVLADPALVEQVLQHLVANARDAMPDGGTLTLSTLAVLVDELHARRFEEVKPGEFVCLTVSDTGCGMSREVKAQIFEPFFTTKDTRKAMGLGLATVHGLVKQQCGWIEFQSEPGQGSSFNVFLPCPAAGSRSRTGTQFLAAAARNAAPTHEQPTQTPTEVLASAAAPSNGQ